MLLIEGGMEPKVAETNYLLVLWAGAHSQLKPNYVVSVLLDGLLKKQENWT